MCSSAAGVLGHKQQGFRGAWLWWICKERMWVCVAVVVVNLKRKDVSVCGCGELV